MHVRKTQLIPGLRPATERLPCKLTSSLIGWRNPRISPVFHPLVVIMQKKYPPSVNTLRPGQNGRRFADDTFKRIFVNENFRISIKISLKFVPKGPINNNPAFVEIMACRRSGDKPLSEPMMVSLLTHICVTRPQWVNKVTTLKIGVDRFIHRD